MYEIKIVAQDINVPSEAEIIKKITPLLKAVLGYRDTEIDLMIKNYFTRPLARGLNEQQVKLIAQPFYDIDAPIIIREYDSRGNTIETAIPYYYEFFNLAKQPPKSHYYDEPVISRDHLVAPDYVPSKPTIELKPQPTTPTITNSQYTPKCPTCNSPDVEKISLTSKVVGGALFGLFSSNVRKTMYCKNCGYKW